MIDYIANTLIVLVICAATLVCGIGISTTLSTSAKAETMSINESMDQLEKLYNELQAFHKTPHYLEYGYSAAGQGVWADEVLKLDKDKELTTYVGELVPDTLAPPHPLWPLKVNDLWGLGRQYYKTGGAENKETHRLKSAFEKLFKLHKSRRK